jgi:hypothetical protein
LATWVSRHLSGDEALSLALRTMSFRPGVNGIEEAVPRRLEVVAKRVGRFRIRFVHARGTEERSRRIAGAARPDRPT